MEVTKMADYDNTNTFALFKQTDKEGNEKRPDYTGSITLEGGKELRLSAWIRESKSGLKYLSGQASEPLNKSNVTNAAVEGEDIPF
tara:strand:- start:351 stop:608 length:258 start_codon:yes stop_codon:yes gene_type:complete